MPESAVLQVPLYDHARRYQQAKSAYDAAIARVLSSGRLDWGPAGSLLEHQREGLNERLDELQAALLQVGLERLPGTLTRRRRHAERYLDALRPYSRDPYSRDPYSRDPYSRDPYTLDLPIERPGYRHSYRNFVIRLDDRDRVQQELAAAGIATGLPYAPPLHLQPAYRDRNLGPGSFPVCEAAAARLLSLPIAPELSDAQLEHVVVTLQRLLEQGVLG